MSELIADSITALSQLPGVGKKSAQRMVFHLLRKDPAAAQLIAELLPRLAREIGYCQDCRDFTERPQCKLCYLRVHKPQLCVVESPVDVLALEQSAVFSGRYFVLHGQLSPIDGIGPEELGIAHFSKILGSGDIEEVILALNGGIDSQTTAHYLTDIIQSHSIKVTRLAQGLPLGGELEYIDAATLTQAFQRRYEQ